MMISLLAERRELRMRKTILRGVLEENLHLMGRRTRRPLGGWLPWPKKLLLSLYLAVLMVVGHGTFLSVQWFPEHQIRASHLVNSPSPEAEIHIPEGTFTGEEYQALLRNHEIPLWKLLGLQVRTIMIDAGHGGNDSGAIGQNGTMEKDLVLDIAKRLRQRLENQGRYRVAMTRQSDRFVPLKGRVEMARQEAADLFISLHLNYLPQKPINIIETFYFGPSQDVKSATLAEKENAGSEFGLNDFKAMVVRLNNDLKRQESKDLAVSIQKNLYARSSSTDSEVFDYGTKPAPFVVLLGVDVPAVLVEVSCLSNLDEEMRLNTESHRENIAHYLETGILDYLSKGEPLNEARR